MAKAAGWGRHEWWRRLTRGVNVGNSPSVMETISPVLIVGDARDLTGHFSTRDGLAGLGVASNAGNSSGFQLQSQSPGGTLIRTFNLMHPGGAGSSDIPNWTFGVAPLNPAATPQAVHSTDPSMPVLSKAFQYIGAAYLLAQIGGIPVVWHGGSTFTTKLASPGQCFLNLWLPPGFCFSIEGISIGLGLAGNVWFTDLPERQASD